MATPSSFGVLHYGSFEPTKRDHFPDHATTQKSYAATLFSSGSYLFMQRYVAVVLLVAISVMVVFVHRHGRSPARRAVTTQYGMIAHLGLHETNAVMYQRATTADEAVKVIGAWRCPVDMHRIYASYVTNRNARMTLANGMRDSLVPCFKEARVLAQDDFLIGNHKVQVLDIWTGFRNFGDDFLASGEETAVTQGLLQAMQVAGYNVEIQRPMGGNALVSLRKSKGDVDKNGWPAWMGPDPFAKPPGADKSKDENGWPAWMGKDPFAHSPRASPSSGKSPKHDKAPKNPSDKEDEKSPKHDKAPKNPSDKEDENGWPAWMGKDPFAHSPRASPSSGKSPKHDKAPKNPSDEEDEEGWPAWMGPNPFPIHMKVHGESVTHDGVVEEVVARVVLTGNKKGPHTVRVSVEARLGGRGYKKTFTAVLRKETGFSQEVDFRFGTREFRNLPSAKSITFNVAAHEAATHTNLNTHTTLKLN